MTALPTLARGDEAELGDYLLAQLAGQGPPLVSTRGRLWRYQPTVGTWGTVAEEEAGMVVQRLAGLPVGDKGTPLRLSDSTVRGAIRCAHRQAHRADFFDQAAVGVAMSNGFVRVDEAGIIHLDPHHPRHRATFALPCPYSGTERSGLWGAFLRASFRSADDGAERVAFLAEFVGACLLGLATSHQRFCLLQGPGGTGKSTFLEVVAALFPPALVTSIPPHQLDQEYARAALSRSALNLVSELPERDLLEVAAVKAAVAGDQMSGRDPYGQRFEFRPRAGHLWAANLLPQVYDASGAWWRRVALVEFVDHPDPPIRDLARRIVRDELGAVALWAIEGAAALVGRGGYALPPSSGRAVDGWRYQGDTVRQWVAEECRVAVGEVTTAGSSLYESYATWAKKNGHHPVAANKFALRLAAQGLTSQRTARCVMWPLELID